MSDFVLTEKRYPILEVRHMQSPDTHRALAVFTVLNLTAFGQEES